MKTKRKSQSPNIYLSVERKTKKQNDSQFNILISQKLQKSNKKITEFDWSTFVLADLQYVIEMADKSILKKLKNKQIIKDLKQFQSDIHQKLTNIDVNGYFWVMLIINRILDDDHSSIKLNNLEQIQTLNFCGLVFNAQVQNGDIIVTVVRSFLKDVDTGDQVIMINNEPVVQFISRNAKKYIKRTYSALTAIKKYTIFMCLENPFDLIQSITINKKYKMADNGSEIVRSFIEQQVSIPNAKAQKRATQSKVLKLESIPYHKAKHQYFAGYDNIFSLMKDLLIEDEERKNQLDVSLIKQGKLLYYDIHSFLSYGDNLFKVEQSTELLKTPDYEWVVIDLRNNAGGSIYLTALLSSYLFDQKIVSQYKKCQNAVFNLDKDFLTRYNEQYIIPVIADPKVSQSIKNQFIQMQQYLLKREQSLFLNSSGKKSNKECSKDMLTSYNKELAKAILKKNNPQYKKIVLITNMHCYSACIHTYNFMRLFPNVVTIGNPVGITTGSGNSIQLQLPSQQAHVILPQLYIQNHNVKFNNAMTNTSTVDLILDTETLLSKQALIVFILEHKRQFLDVIKNRAKQLIKTSQ